MADEIIILDPVEEELTLTEKQFYKGEPGADAVLPENIVIDALYNNYSTEEKALVATIPNKVDKLTGYSLVADAEILKIHARNTDSTLLSENGEHTVYLDNSGVLHVKDISQVGTLYVTHAEQIYTTKNEIILRDGAIAGLGVGEVTGLRAKLYDGVNDGNLVFDRDGWARVGDVGALQKLATIEESPTNGYLMKYNTATYRLESIDPLTLPVSTAMQTALGLKANLSGGNTFLNVQSMLDGVKLTKIYPNVDGTSAVQITKSDGTTVVASFDTTNLKLLSKGGFTFIDSTTSGMFYTTGSGGVLYFVQGSTSVLNCVSSAGSGLITVPGNSSSIKANSGIFSKIVPNSDTTGVVIRNAADSADVVYFDTLNKRQYIYSVFNDINNYERMQFGYDNAYYGLQSQAAGNGTLRGIRLSAGASFIINGGGCSIGPYQSEAFQFITERATGRYGYTNGSTVDLATYRNSPGILEINNGTAGQYRDLILRDLTTSGGKLSYGANDSAGAGYRIVRVPNA